MKRLYAFCLCLYLFGGSVRAEMRIWNSPPGQEFSGEYDGVLFGEIVVKDQQGKKRFIPKKELSLRDKVYFDKVFVPEVEITYSKDSRGKFRSKNALPNDHVNIITGRADIQEKGEFESKKLSVELFLLGADVAEPDCYSIIGKASAPLEFTETNEYRSELSTEAESRRYQEYNYQLRGTEYIGYVILILDAEKRCIEYKTDIKWLDEEEIPLLRELKKGQFFDENCWEMPVPRPEYSTSRVGIQ